MPPIFIYFLLALFSFVLANESTPLLFTFGSAFIRRCEWKHDATLIYSFIACWLCFRSYSRTKAPNFYYLLFTFGSAFVRRCEWKHDATHLFIIISCWLCFRSYSRTKALHSYLLSSFPNPVSANKSNPLWLFIIYFWLCFRS